jgi:uncharacterized protein (DUF1800 family)
MIDPSTLVAIRFGYGLPSPTAAPLTAGAMIAALKTPDAAVLRFPAVGLAGVLPVLQAADQGRRVLRRTKDRTAYTAAVKEARGIAANSVRCGFARALDSPDGFRERLVSFWADHFTTKSRSAPGVALPGAMIEDAIRPNLSGRFGDLLVAATLHPAMLIYLDQVASVGPGSAFGQKRGRGLNENLAREVMELHSLGVGGGYAQKDVRQMAELLTGLDAGSAEGFAFHADRAEPGSETILGKTYDGAGTAPIRAALQDLALRPETARHIARKLAVHFVSDVPDAGLVAAMSERYRATDGDLLAVYRAMLDHPAAWAPPLAKARQPYDFMIAALRSLGVDGAGVMRFGAGPFQRLVLNPMALMGQKWGAPNGPDGWPEAADNWITPQGLAVRIRWAMEVPGRLLAPLPDPAEFARNALGSAVDDRLLWAASRAESLREGIGLVLASPAFNRR